MGNLGRCFKLLLGAFFLSILLSPSLAGAQDSRQYRIAVERYEDYTDWNNVRRYQFLFDDTWPVGFGAPMAGFGWGFGFERESRAELFVGAAIALRLRWEFNFLRFFLLMPEVGYEGILDLEFYEEGEQEFYSEHYGRAGLRVGVGVSFAEVTIEPSLLLGRGPRGLFAGGIQITLNQWLWKGVFGFGLSYVWRTDGGFEEHYHTIKLGISLDIPILVALLATYGGLAS